ncbi:helix-turn-helix domain-containing protein [Schinkia azotoformans]|uniref:helix-turn-helix domain-containing protein n=1 Tax=Schinkia azotoformans TaxID=1454 RepID=UPI002DBB47EE|nr:helix-turn-helix transcriptional regulator [Schinkia azotoformans]MEC1743325.1 helix-turn-helix transcriptional regulator [Schinkia azotoformans]
MESAILKFKHGFVGEAFNPKNSNSDSLIPREDFGERIQKIRKTKGLSIKELAEKIQVSEEFLLKTEQNKTEPSKYFIHSLSTTFNMDYDDLIENLFYVKSDAILKIINISN